MAVVGREAEQLTPLLDAKKFALRAADDEDVNGKKAAVVVVTPKDGQQGDQAVLRQGVRPAGQGRPQGDGPGRRRGQGEVYQEILPVGLQEGERGPGARPRWCVTTTARSS